MAPDTKLSPVSESSGPSSSTPSHPASYPWPPQSATGAGSLPGTDPREAIRLIFDELPDFPHLAELPGRGIGADMIGRTAALLVDLPVDATTGGWRFADRPGRDLRRAKSLLARDLDALEEVADGYRGPLKVQVCGPWTMAARIELIRSQEPALADPGAVADLIASLAEGVAAHVADVAIRVPGAQLVLQLDEPALPTVLAGQVPSASGLNRVRVIEEPDAESGLRTVLAAARAPVVVHCCALSAPVRMMASAGAIGAGIDLSQLRRGEEEAVAEVVEAGLALFAGVIPATPQAAPRPEPSAGQSGTRAGQSAPQRDRAGELPPPHAVAAPVVELWRRMGWPVARPAPAPALSQQPAARPAPAATAQPQLTGAAAIAAQLVLTPACGLAGAPPRYARAVLACCRDAARLLPELIDEEVP